MEEEAPIKQEEEEEKATYVTVELLKSKSHLTSNGLMELINIRASLNKGLSDSLK